MATIRMLDFCMLLDWIAGANWCSKVAKVSLLYLSKWGRIALVIHKIHLGVDFGLSVLSVRTSPLNFYGWITFCFFLGVYVTFPTFCFLILGRLTVSLVPLRTLQCHRSSLVHNHQGVVCHDTAEHLQYSLNKKIQNIPSKTLIWSAYIS